MFYHLIEISLAVLHFNFLLQSLALYSLANLVPGRYGFSCSVPHDKGCTSKQLINAVQHLFMDTADQVGS